MKVTKPDSSLVTYIDPNGTEHYNSRTAEIDVIIPHHAANGTGFNRGYAASTLAAIFSSVGTGGSVQYGIDSNGKIGQQLPEMYRAWTSNSRQFDMRAITIETANDGGDPDWHISDKALASLVALCTDICKRRGKTKLIWIANKNTALNYKPAKNEMLLLIHMWVADPKYPTGCPGSYMISKMPYIAETVTKALGSSTASTPVSPSASTTAKKSVDEIAKEVVQGKWGAGEERKKKLTAAGYDYATVQAKVDQLMKGASSATSSSTIKECNAYLIKVTDSAGLNIRKGPGVNYTLVSDQICHPGGIYTIIAESVVAGQTWGKLKSGAGWICLTGHTMKYGVSTKTLEEVAKEVIQGKWGAGNERAKKLTAAGYNYTAVQAKVNELLKK